MFTERTTIDNQSNAKVTPHPHTHVSQSCIERVDRRRQPEPRESTLHLIVRLVFSVLILVLSRGKNVNNNQINVNTV